jgi:hypothetical protein
MGQLLDTHFPMPDPPPTGGTGPRGRPPTSPSDAVLLPLHMVWMDTQEDEMDQGVGDWFYDSAMKSPFPGEGPTSTSASLAPPASTNHATIPDEFDLISSDRAPINPEQRQDTSGLSELAPVLESDSEPELPACQPVINRKVSWITLKTLITLVVVRVRRGDLSRGKDDEELKMVMEVFYRRISMIINMK